MERIYCDGCGTELPRDELKLELKSIKHSNPTHPEDSIYFRTAANRDKSYERYLESIDNGKLSILKVCTNCGTPTPVIYVSKFGFTGSWTIIPFIAIASMILLLGNCVVVVAHMEDMAIPMGLWTLVIGIPAIFVGISSATSYSPIRQRKMFILGLFPVLLVNGTCSGLFFLDNDFQSELVYEVIEDTLDDVTTLNFEVCCDQYQISLQSYERIADTRWASQYKIESVSATCDSRRIHDVYLRFYESINNSQSSWSTEQEKIVWNKVVEYLDQELKPSGAFMVQKSFQTREQTNLFRIFSGQQDVFMHDGSRIPLQRSYGFNEIMECTAQEVTYIVKVVPSMRYACEFGTFPTSGLCEEVELDLSFKEHVLADESDLWMYDGLEVLVNAYLFISEDETPDIKAKTMRVIPQTGEEVTRNIMLSWYEKFPDSQYAIKYGGEN